MKIKSLLLGSAAALIAVSGAQAADAVMVEPEPVEYVRICDAYGAGFFYIPGTETCLKFSGYVRVTYRSRHFHDEDLTTAAQEPDTHRH
ncbi:MAG: porin, partial [bacterium]|nr:porin [bacterium]